MKTKPTHTPTYFLDGQFLIEQDAQGGNTIADIRADDGVREMILRAVNSRTEILEALKNYAQADWSKGNVESPHYLIAMQAIAKAEGK